MDATHFSNVVPFHSDSSQAHVQGHLDYDLVNADHEFRGRVHVPKHEVRVQECEVHVLRLLRWAQAVLGR